MTRTFTMHASTTNYVTAIQYVGQSYLSEHYCNKRLLTMWISRAASGPSENTHKKKHLLNVLLSHQRATVVLESNMPFVIISLLTVIVGVPGSLNAWITHFLNKRVEKSESVSERWQIECVNGLVITGDNKLSSGRGLAILSRSKGNRQLIQFRPFSHPSVYAHIYVQALSHYHMGWTAASFFPKSLLL